MRFSSPKKTNPKIAALIGQEGEYFALLLLRLKGYKCLARNYKTPLGEIDLVMKKRKEIIFVEVKSRPTQKEALEALRDAQKKRILKSGQWFLNQHKEYTHYQYRFDVIAIAPKTWPKHIQNAWGEM